MKRHRQTPPETRGAAAQPRREVKPQDEAAGDRSYGDRASEADPDPAPEGRRTRDDTAPHERYDATAEAADRARRTPGQPEDPSAPPDR
ncbi:hypothetical protein [Kitasatospora sp. NPDC051914]|uniref:hypothetical protein n=1 Tax=Kitasatospora sp. NPDC051914 TaxID=3154945 RepID=UPI003422920E